MAEREEGKNPVEPKEPVGGEVEILDETIDEQVCKMFNTEALKVCSRCDEMKEIPKECPSNKILQLISREKQRAVEEERERIIKIIEKDTDFSGKTEHCYATLKDVRDIVSEELDKRESKIKKLFKRKNK